jgi:hypothetical protein
VVLFEVGDEHLDDDAAINHGACVCGQGSQLAMSLGQRAAQRQRLSLQL